jgi:DNA-directed RNA polymerase subunit RPC12/RpoP
MEREKVLEFGRFHYWIKFESSYTFREEVCPYCGKTLITEKLAKVKNIKNEEKGLPLEISKSNPFLRRLVSSLNLQLEENVAVCPNCSNTTPPIVIAHD